MGCTSSITGKESVEPVSEAAVHAKPSSERDFHREYALREKLDEGASGVLYAATHMETRNEQLVVKVVDMRDALKKHFYFDDRRVHLDMRREKNIANEVAMLSAASGHDNVCRMFEHFVHGGLAYIVLERYDRTLPEALASCATLNEEVFRPFFQGMLAGAAALHARRIAHRGVKPDNFMCSGPDNIVKLCDFRFACALEPVGALESAACAGGVCGTAPYMAPELLGNKKYGVKVDVWSFGVIVHVFLCGCFPYTPQDMTTGSMKAAILNGAPTSVILDPSEDLRACGGISEEARSLIIRLLSRCAKRRPTSRETLRDEFFTSRSLSKACLRGKFEVARSCGAFGRARARKVDAVEVDARLRQLQDRRCGFAGPESRSRPSEVSTAGGSSAGETGESSQSTVRSDFAVWKTTSRLSEEPTDRGPRPGESGERSESAAPRVIERVCV